MGWGAKKAAAPAPQPEDQVDLAIARKRLKEPSITGEELASQLEALNDPPITQESKAQIAWHQLRARKGYAGETLNMVFYDFIKSKGLFADLIGFVSKRR